MKNNGLHWLYIFSGIFMMACSNVKQEDKPQLLFEWEELPDIPQAVGGPIAGVSNDALVVAGGAYWTASMFQGGTKIWHDDIYVLEAGDQQWQKGFSLPRPLAYSATVNTNDGIVCIGGHDSVRVYANVFRMRWNRKEKRVEIDSLPDLPGPVTFAGAAMVGDVIYVAGGQESMDAKTALKNFWALDLSKKEEEFEWEVLEPWPGPSRLISLVAAQSDGENLGIYLFSGTEIIETPEGKIPRRCLSDGYRYDPLEKQWQKLADMDQAAAAGVVIPFGPTHILVFSGTDCKADDQFWELKDDNPVLSPTIRAYHTITDTWAIVGEMPGGNGVVTSRALEWQGGIVIVSGEDRASHRTPKVWLARPKSPITTFGFINYAVVGVYFSLLVLMGIYLSRREKTTHDFFLGGKRVPWWAAGLSIFGTQLSALTFMALPAKVYATDWTYFLGQGGIILVTPLVIYFYLPFFRRLDITTAYEYLELRFNLLIRLIGSFNFVMLQVARMAIVLYLPSVALSTVTGIDMYLSILTMGILSTLYTVLGGIEAVIWTDVIQVVVLMGGAVIGLVLIITQFDAGVGDMIAFAWSQGKFDMLNWSADYTTTAVWVVVVGTTISTFLGYTSDQTVIQRYLTTPTEKQAAKALWTNALMSPPSSIIFFGLGTGLFLFYQNHPQLLQPELTTDAILPLFIVQQLPVGISGLVIAALFAAAMSSLDSSMNSVSTTVVTDFYRRFKTAASDAHRLNLARWITVMAGVVGTGSAVLLATYQIQSVWDMIFILSGLIGGGLGGIFILGIFTRAAHSRGVLVGLITSAVVMYFVQQFTHIHFFLFVVTGVSVCVLVGYLASLFISSGKPYELDGLTIFTKRPQDPSQ